MVEIDKKASSNTGSQKHWKVWFSFEYLYGHGANKELCNIIIYDINEVDIDYEDFYKKAQNWILVLSKKRFWVYKPEIGELEEIKIKKIRLLLNKRLIRYKNHDSIIKKYIKHPRCLRNILDNLFISPDNRDNIKDILLSSGEEEFYLGKFIQIN